MQALMRRPARETLLYVARLVQKCGHASRCRRTIMPCVCAAGGALAKTDLVVKIIAGILGILGVIVVAATKKFWGPLFCRVWVYLSTCRRRRRRRGNVLRTFFQGRRETRWERMVRKLRELFRRFAALRM